MLQRWKLSWRDWRLQLPVHVRLHRCPLWKKHRWMPRDRVSGEWSDLRPNVPYSQSRLCFAYLTKRTKLFSRLCVQSSIKVNRNTALITLKGNENKFARINLNLESQAKTKSSDRFNENGGFGPWTRAQCMRLSEDPSKEWCYVFAHLDILNLNFLIQR